MATTEKQSTYREDFPGYQGHIPYKFSIIGKTVGATNETIKELLTTEPPKSTLLRPSDNTDFSHYDRDYYCDTFYRGYPLEEDKIYSNRSKEAQTWIVGDKYKIYPQHIPGVKCHVPGIYSSNIYGLPYAKTTAVSIKGDYNKNPDCSDKERFTSTNMDTYTKPRTRSLNEEKELEENEKKYSRTFYSTGNNIYNDGKRKFYNDIRRIYHSKIAQVPTVGYAGTQSIFQKQISYLNYDKIMEQEKREKEGVMFKEAEGLPPKFKESLKSIQPDTDVPYVVGYKGFRTAVKAENVHGENFHDASLEGRNISKMRANNIYY